MANITSRKQRGRGWGPLAQHASDTVTQGALNTGIPNYHALTFWDHDEGRMWKVSLTDDEARKIVGALSESLDRGGRK